MTDDYGALHSYTQRDTHRQTQTHTDTHRHIDKDISLLWTFTVT